MWPAYIEEIRDYLAAIVAGTSTTKVDQGAAGAAPWPVEQRGGAPVAFSVAVTDVAGKLKATTFPVIPGSVSVEVTAGSGGAVSIGGATVTSADLANAIGSREDGLYWADLTNVYAVCPAGKTATLLVRAVVA